MRVHFTRRDWIGVAVGLVIAAAALLGWYVFSGAYVQANMGFGPEWRCANPYATGAVCVKAGEGADMLFNLELTYAGIFRVTNVAQEHLHPIVMIECPRLLFPFARQIIANCTQQGGFPPMMLDPIDFVSLYRQRMAQQQPAAAN